MASGAVYKFGVVRWTDCDTEEVRLCGNVDELGSWNPEKGVVLQPSLPLIPDQPAFWQGEVSFPISLQSNIPLVRYKFVVRHTPISKFQFEGCGEQHNRTLTNGSCTFHNKTCLVQPARWLEEDGESNERHLTKNFYHHVICNNNGIHFSKIRQNLWLGSCPRQFYHIAILKGLGVTAVMSLQTIHDLEQNVYGVLNKDNQHDHHMYGSSLVDALTAMYQHHGMAFIWMPAEDMSTQGRIRVLPQAVFLLHGLLTKVDTG